MKIHIFVILIFLSNILFAQNKEYFQQEVNYKISVKLNDSLHILTANEEIEYINNSSDTLEFLYFHLWPNAYKNTQTAFAKQEIKTGDLEFYESDSTEKGEIYVLVHQKRKKILRFFKIKKQV